MQAPAKGTKRRSISYAKWGYIFIAPFFIAFAIFQLIPLASTIYYSFFEYYRSGLKVIGPNFTGLSNYVKLGEDRDGARGGELRYRDRRRRPCGSGGCGQRQADQCG